MNKKSDNGITLISLIVTIIILLILTGISIGSLTGESGLINGVKQAKEETDIKEEKEKIELAIIQAMKHNRYGELTKKDFQEEIRKKLEEENNVYELENKYITQIEKSKRVYSITKDGEKIEIETIENLILAKYTEEIKNAYEEAKKSKNEIAEIFAQIKETLKYEGTIGSVSMNISTKDGYKFTLLEDGTVLEGILAYLNIADGTIELYETGYKQNNGDLIEYTGDYVITGETTENVVKVLEEGTYNITIKDLKIDVSGISNQCAINANSGYKTNNCFVNITLKGDNYLYGGGSAAALGFAKATPNINGETTGSTLTIQGEGYLEAVGGGLSAGIGSGYTGFGAAQGDSSNIIINSGNIVAKAGTNGCAIGGAHRRSANNLIINGGNIQAIASNRFGIGAGAEATADNIVINGGKIYATGGEYGGAIGGYDGSGKITINGGIIETKTTHKYSSIGYECSEVEITGGTIITNTPKYAAFSYNYPGTIKITGGSILANGTIPFGVKDESNELTETLPTDGVNNLYLTSIQLLNIKEKTKIKSITLSDDINYGITDIYTSEEGILYLYLPEGTRTITIETSEKEYVGEVITSQNNVIKILEQK